MDPSPIIDGERNLPRPRAACARTIGDALLAAAAAWPDADALAFPDERVSYAGLLQRAWRSALSMSALGVEPGDHVGLFMQNSVECITTFFGIAILGARAVPVNVRNRSEELRFVLRDSDVRLVVTHDRYASYADLPDVLAQCLPELASAKNARQLQLPTFPKLRSIVSYGTTKRDGVVSYAEFEGLVAEADGARVAKWCDSVALRSIAAIIYTSGTTSRPRGAMLPHEALIGGWGAVADRWTVQQKDRFWVPVPLFHIAALGPLMAVVSRGACFISDGWFDAARAIVQIEGERATMLYTVYPPITQSLISHPRFSTADFSSVRWWLNVAPPDTLAEMARALPRAIQVTTYGGTEGGPVTLGAPDEDEAARLNTCGKPLAGLEVRIVDTQNGAELPVGVAGEILYRGYPTFSGYYQDAEKTSASLDPQGWFHSGDLGQFDGEGRLIYLGRIKEMLKIGGENVAPAEIEALLASHPAVKLVQVVGIPDSRLVEVPAAFVELHTGETVDAATLLDFCRGRIASFKVPRYLRFVAEWPMSATNSTQCSERALAEGTQRWSRRMSGLCFDFSEEQQMLRESVRRFTEREATKADARAWERSGEFPKVLYERLAAAGLYSISVPEEYGGQGGDLIDQVIVCEEFARTLAGLSVLWHLNCWSGVKAIATHGAEAQRAKYLPALARGRTLFAFAMTEPGGGTDVLHAMRTRAQPVDGGFIVNGSKIWSTLAHVADQLLLLARTSDGGRPSEGLSVMIVDAKAPGVSARPIPKLGLRALGSCEVVFNDVFVPQENLLGSPGSGWSYIVGSLNNERILTAAMCTGMLAGVLEDAVAYSQSRKAFGRPIGQHQSIQHKIADMKMKLETARLHTYRAAWLQSQARPCAVEANIAKCLASEYAVAAADEGIQILGGYGYAEEFDMQRYWRDARLFRIGPITNEMVRNSVGESLGLPRSY